jgi:hypothetical protein
VRDGLTHADIAKLQAQRPSIEVQNDPVLFPDAAMSRRDKAAEALHGRLVRKKWRDAQSGRDSWFLG